MEDKGNLNYSEVPLTRYLLAFLVATVLFVVIFLGAYSVSYMNYQGICSEQVTIGKYISDLQSTLEKSGCEDSLLYDSSDRLDRAGSQISLLETRFGANNLLVLEQKKLYSELEYKHFQLVKQMNEKCNKSFTTMLFFYSNSEDSASQEKDERISFILGTLKNMYPKKVMIYSFSYKLDVDVINKMKEDYNIDHSPVVIVNEKYFVDVKNIDDLIRHIE